VLVSDGVIAAVGASLPVPPGCRELDAAGLIVAPGLVDTHWHLWNTLLRGMSGQGPGYFRLMGRLGRAFGAENIYHGTLLAGMTGSLTPGKRADLILVSPGGPNLGVLTDPAQMLVTAVQPANVDTVIVDGRILKRGGALTTLDVTRIGGDARRALSGILERAG
jgi:cytosine/adenosine deaminase-related metal-dependent hydrolase